MSEELRRTCEQLKPLIGDAADALWSQYELAELPAQKLEAAHMIRMMGISHLGSNVTRNDIRLIPSTVIQEEEINLGAVLYPGKNSQPLGLKLTDFSRHIGIYATSGSGKTNLMFHILRQLSQKGIPYLVIDWKRSYRNLKNDSLIANLHVYTVGREASPFEWNPLRPPPNIHIQSWIQVLSEVIESSHVSGQGVADVFIENIDKEFEAKGFYDSEKEVKEYPNFYDVRNRVERTRYGGRKALWQDSCLRILTTFTFGPGVRCFNSRSPIKLELLLKQPVVLELDMELPKPIRKFFSETILRWLHLYRLGQGETKRLRHVLVLEEAHNIFSTASFATSNSAIENIYKEIRSYSQGLISITQHCCLLPIYVLGNTATLILMSLTHAADIRSGREALFLKRDEDVYLDRLKVGEGIVKIKNRIPACHVRFPLVPIELGSVKDEDLKQ